MKKWIIRTLIGAAIWMGSGDIALSRTLTLDKNTVVLRSSINDLSVSKLIYKINSTNRKKVVLFISSPGGSVIAGDAFIDFMKGSGRKFTCITDFAASMAFTIFQQCDRRYILDSGILMQHLASIRVGGEEPNAIAMLKLIQTINRKQDAMDAKALGISTTTYRKKVTAGDWWMTGSQAKSQKAADQVVRIRCTRTLVRSTEMVPEIGMFGVTQLKFSRCPLVNFPMVYGDIELISSYDRKKWDSKFIHKLNAIGGIQ